jgi:CheY-like chemotaxis protein
MVLLDLGMPGMSGLEVAAHVRQQPEFQGVVLAALTGWGREEDRTRSLAAGFDHHLTKPVSAEALQACSSSSRSAEAGRLPATARQTPEHR